LHHKHGLGRRFWAWVRLVHPFPAAAVTLTGLGLAVLTSPVTWDQVVRIGLMVAASQVAIGSFNEFCDAPSDAIGQPGKPIPSGLVPRSGALLLVAIGLAACIGIAATFGVTTMILAGIGCAIGLVYDYPLKRSRWSWAPYVLAVPLLPIWIWSALGRLTAEMWGIYPAGALLALSAHIANAIPADAADRAAGTWTIVQHLGLTRSRLVLRAAFAGAGLLGAAVILPVNASPPVLAAGAGAMFVGTVGSLLISRSGQERLAFRLMATASGLLGLGVGLAFHS
jgi:4-hydroxybenzoate polyprenyltransferase